MHQLLDFVTQKGTGGQSIYGAVFEGILFLSQTNVASVGIVYSIHER